MRDEADPFRIDVREGIHLAPICASDKEAFVRWLSDREIYENTLRIPHPYRPEDAEQFLGAVTEATARHDRPVHFAIRDDSGQLVGVCGFDDLVPGHRAAIGYWLARPLWGQGIMTDVVRSICDFAFQEWNLVRITAWVFDFNQASARVLEKNGFEFEGLLRKHHRKEGRFLDSRLYALVR